jgi:hypothetical protein
MKKKMFTVLPLILLLFVITLLSREKSKIAIVKLSEQTLVAVKILLQILQMFQKSIRRHSMKLIALLQQIIAK